MNDKQYLTALVQAIDAGDSDQKSLSNLLTQKPMDARILVALAQVLRGSGHRKHQQDAANKKHRETKKAKVFTSREWVLKRHKFKSNIEFCRAVVPLVLRKFSVVVKAETIARDWVKGFDHPHADTRPNNAIAYTGGQYFAKKTHLSLDKK